jgi:hypothetical protein
MVNGSEHDLPLPRIEPGDRRHWNDGQDPNDKRLGQRVEHMRAQATFIT